MGFALIHAVGRKTARPEHSPINEVIAIANKTEPFVGPLRSDLVMVVVVDVLVVVVLAAVGLAVIVSSEDDRFTVRI